jgi:hypothetical protein
MTQKEIAMMPASVPLLHEETVPAEELPRLVNLLAGQLKKLKTENETLKQKLDFHGLL